MLTDGLCVSAITHIHTIHTCSLLIYLNLFSRASLTLWSWLQKLSKILGVSSDLRCVFNLFSPTLLPETWWSELFLLLVQTGDRWVFNSEKHVFLHQISDVVRTTQTGLRQNGLSGDKQDLRLFWQGNFSKRFESSLGGDKHWNVEGYPSVDCLGLLVTVKNMFLESEFCAVVKWIDKF